MRCRSERGQYNQSRQTGVSNRYHGQPHKLFRQLLVAATLKMDMGLIPKQKEIRMP
jgi:hypothetical protein